MNTNFSKATELFSKSLSKVGKSINTIVAYKGDINQLCSFLEESKLATDVTQIKTEHIEKFKEDLTSKSYTAKSISRKINSIKNFFIFLKNEGLIEENPSINIQHPKYENSLPKILKPIEYRALRDACRNDLRSTAIVELMLQCGLRIKEIESLKLNDVDDKQINIEAYESHPQRFVPLNNSVKNALKNYINNARFQSKTKNVFVTKTGRILLARNIRSLLNRYFRKADIKNVKVNDLRNTFIAFQLKGGVPLDIVSKIVGHKRISTTEKYLELIDTQKQSRGIKLKEL
ncbi:hypothetical protein DRH14_02875 [Candidatus Shapirobacteria bacterium]|nr:MAG: hypothetical protein DRH14_02875 [Candidatus Shapirobacteria bacterium]